jgi:starch synthase (maltosyl-transferring)
LEGFVREGYKRAVIDGLDPEVDRSEFAAKRIVGQTMTVYADIVCDGHDKLSARLKWRKCGDKTWHVTPMDATPNDRWRGTFVPDELGFYEYTVIAWVDHFKTWRVDLDKKTDAGQDVTTDLMAGGILIEEAASRATGLEKRLLQEWAKKLQDPDFPEEEKIALASDDHVILLTERYPDTRLMVEYPRAPKVWVDRERAGFSAWYEFFPRSTSPDPGKHGTFKDCEAWLPHVAGMGFDVVYFPPIHPIGRTARKGKNNTLNPEPGDVGSPWAIGGPEGGHKSVHPDLGTLQDFDALVARARDDFGLEIALDIAFQCSPEHPYVNEHPEWFMHRPDGTIKHAENPPKKYEDIYPFNFECEEWEALWEELKSVFLFWMDHGVRIFRVDNPHTKPFKFWEWVIHEIHTTNPDVLFLAEAFTRPKMMNRLAKGCFSQSYTYFTWRNDKHSLTQYMQDLTNSPMKDFFRPNFWPNTPDILNEFLQHGGRGAFINRLVLAATLSSNYGIYGPAFEQMESAPREPGSEEYLDSEKYQVRHWHLHSEQSLSELIARVNEIRRENPALQTTNNVKFHHIDNDSMICYSKSSPDGQNTVLVIVNMDPHREQGGWTALDLNAMGVLADQEYQVDDLLRGERYTWDGPYNFVKLNPHTVPVHIFRIRRRMRTEQDFEYFL